MTSAHGTITCLNCSRSLGEVAREDGRVRLVRLSLGELSPRGRLLCRRCHGFAFIDWEP
jgi:hypothetical protein